ncbi:hypothetical protein LUZ60_010168 [Juncus effusus]|nr:hypothetical protein LUZ60_010168 [Juncus effusus]
MDCWCHGMRRFWYNLAARLGLRRTGSGLGKLKKEVRTCEYRDVQVMWEMLRKNELQITEVNGQTAIQI